MSCKSITFGCIVGLDANAAPDVPAGNNGVGGDGSAVGNPCMGAFGENKDDIAPPTTPPIF